MSARISVLVPVLNEAACLPLRLAELSPLGLHELLVIDGGSEDGSDDLAEGRAGVRLLRAERGRGRQIHAGAQAATGDILLILHADVQLPRGWMEMVRETLAQPGVVAGAFKTWHAAPRHPLRGAFHVADLRSRVSELPYGDQALFCWRRDYLAVGGCPAQLMFEDIELARRLATRGRIARVDARVQVSARRFAAAPLKYLVLMNTLPILYRLGVPLPALERLYGRVR